MTTKSAKGIKKAAKQQVKKASLKVKTAEKKKAISPVKQSPVKQPKKDDAQNHIIPSNVIQKKRDGKVLSEAEIRYFADGLTKGTLPEYQMAALNMAICFQGMNFDETMYLTKAIVESGKVMQWKKGGYLVDKQSTGGQGDKTSLILAPLLACQGVRIPMISGRGLGPTGGTLDKLESIKGFRVGLTLDEV